MTDAAAYDTWASAQHEHTDTRLLPELEHELVTLLLERDEQAAAWPPSGRTSATCESATPSGFRCRQPRGG